MHRVCCTYHPEASLIEDDHAGDTICSQCGLVVGDRVIDVSTEWRRLSNVNKAVADSSNCLEFAGSSHHNVCNADKTLLAAVAEMTAMADRLNLTQSIKDRAHLMLKRLHERRALTRRCVDAMSAACLYTACRNEDAPRTPSEFCAVSMASKKEIGRCFRTVLKETSELVDMITTDHDLAAI